MKRAALLLGMLMLAASAASAQNTGALSGWCNLGASQAQTQGLSSANYQQGIIPGCTVTVYLHGTTTLATIFSDGINTPLANPFTAGTNGQWTFYSALNSGVDVIGSGPPSGIPPNVYPAPVDLCIDCFASAQVTTPVGGPALETNGVANADQTYLDLDNGSGVIVTNTSGGHVNFAVNAALLNPPSYQRAILVSDVGNVVNASLTVATGDLMVALSEANCYTVQAPTSPVISDSQSNVWNTDASGTGSYIGGTGTGGIAAHTFATATGTLTVTNTAPAGCHSAILLMDFKGIGIDVANVQVGSVNYTTLAPAATATQTNDLAIVPVIYFGTNATATPGTQIFVDPGGQNLRGSAFQFTALNPGLVTTSTTTFQSTNFPVAAVILIKSGLGYGTMSNPMYAAGQMIMGGPGGSPNVLPAGTDGQVLQSSAGSPAWSSNVALPGTLTAASMPNAAPSQPSFIVSPTCAASQPNCLKVYADTQYVIDATTTNGSPTVTCPNNDCNFPASDVGKVVWATTQGSGLGYLTNTSYVCPQTTITAVNSPQSITLGAACTASGTANVVLIWGHDDGPTLATLGTVAGCAVIHFSTNGWGYGKGAGFGMIMDSQPWMSSTSCISPVNTATGAAWPAIIGDGFMASQATFVLTPNFNWSASVSVPGAQYPVAIGGVARVISNIQLWGTGLGPGDNPYCANANSIVVLSGYPPSTVLSGVDIGGICPGQANLEGIELNSYDETLSEGGAQNVGQFSCVGYQKSHIVLNTDDCLNVASGSHGVRVTGGASLQAYSNYPLDNVLVDSGSTLMTSSSYFDSAQGGQNSITNNGTVIDLGGNLLHALPTGTGVWTGPGVLYGTCQGTPTAGATLGFFGFGQFSTPACTSTTVNQGIVLKNTPLSGSLFMLTCRSSTGGVNASDGVCKILKNGVPTSGPALTCTIGTGTSCTDSADFSVGGAGDVYSCSVTTQAGTTLSNLTCSVLAW